MCSVGRDDLAILRVHGTRDDRGVAARHAHSHHDGFGSAGGAFIHAGIGDLHAREFADHRLELEHGLQRTLRNLRLVGRVAGQELAALHEGVDDDGLVVLVNSGAEKAGVAGRVVLRITSETLDDFAFAMLTRHVKIAGQLVLGGDSREQIVDRIDTNLCEHREAIPGALRQITHGSSVLSLRLQKSRRPSRR